MMRIGKRHKDCTLDNYEIDGYNKSAHEECVNVVQKIHSMVISGPVGTGKTHLLIGTGKALRERKVDVDMWAILDLAQKLRGAYDEELVNRLIKVRVLILDDLGAERTTNFILETVEYIIDFRYRQMRPILIGTNLSVKELLSRYGNRFISRMSDGVFVRMSGKDRRLDE